jgi:formate hydrogenlyase subunit 6/NADH:ubiquinone oxidoreductase subunit I
VCTDCVTTGGCVGVEICPTEAIVAATTAMVALTAAAI